MMKHKRNLSRYNFKHVEENCSRSTAMTKCHNCRDLTKFSCIYCKRYICNNCKADHYKHFHIYV